MYGHLLLQRPRNNMDIIYTKNAIHSKHKKKLHNLFYLIRGGLFCYISNTEKLVISDSFQFVVCWFSICSALVIPDFVFDSCLFVCKISYYLHGNFYYLLMLQCFFSKQYFFLSKERFRSLERKKILFKKKM